MRCSTKRSALILLSVIGFILAWNTFAAEPGSRSNRFQYDDGIYWGDEPVSPDPMASGTPTESPTPCEVRCGQSCCGENDRCCGNPPKCESGYGECPCGQKQCGFTEYYPGGIRRPNCIDEEMICCNDSPENMLVCPKDTACCQGHFHPESHGWEEIRKCIDPKTTICCKSTDDKGMTVTEDCPSVPVNGIKFTCGPLGCEPVL